jgi:hypothetical protein
MKRGQLRYRVKIDVRAAYDKVEVGLTELVRDHRQELLKLIEQMDDASPRELEETIYKHLEIDLCPACQAAYIRNPIHFHPESGEATPVDIDSFLRSLGYGKSEDADAE